MTIVPVVSYIKNKLQNTDWKLLLFLLLFLNVKLAVKIAAIALLYLVQPDFKFGVALKNSRLPIFYICALVLAVLNLFLFNNFGHTNPLVFLTGILIWALCILAVHQLKLFTEHADTNRIHKTLTIFFLLNAVCSFLNIGLIILETHRLNPYLYQGNYQKYFINTGDYIRGITFDTSTTNAVISAMGAIYFIVQQRFKMVLVCVLVLLLTVSNFIILLLGSTLVYMLVFRSNRLQKSMISMCIMLIIVFMSRVSPQNNRYALEIFKKAVHGTDISAAKPQKKEVRITDIPDNRLSHEQRKRKFAMLYLDSVSLVRMAAFKALHKPVAQTVKLFIPGDSIHTITFQSRSDTTAQQQKLIDFINSHGSDLKLSLNPKSVSQLPGKLVAFKQTADFLKQHPAKLLTGDGMGNFSSKLAFRSTGLDISGGFPMQYASISPDFLTNHLDVYLDFFSRRKNHHSLANSPNSTLNQLAGEYGFLGLLAFAVFYLGFFLRHYRNLSYGLPLLLFILGVFLMDYWFEQLSVVVLFELMIFLDIKERSFLKTGAHA